MLVFDDGKLKLLKMKEKLLELSTEGHDQILSEYKSIVLEIDKELYEALVNFIKNTDYHNVPLKEKLDFLTSVQSEYISFNEFQCKYRNIYEKYTDDKLKLSDISKIYIDKIVERIDAINGYLINIKNIEENSKKLEELNVELIDSEKKKDVVYAKFKSLEEELKNSILSAEGRLYNANGGIEYTSIENEFSINGIDLKVILGDNNLLEQEVDEANDLMLSEKDTMNSAKICYDNMPNEDTKKLYDDTFNNYIRAKYKLTLLRIVDLVSKEFNNYYDLKVKRIKIGDLIKERLKYLNQLGVKLLIDPFDRIRIGEQLEIIDSLQNNLKYLSSIKDKIGVIVGSIENAQTRNNELFILINQDVTFVDDKTSMSELTSSFSNDTQTDDLSNISDEEYSKKIINIRKAADSFNNDIIHEKTKGVISRVYEMLTTVPLEYQHDSVIPELIIEKNNEIENVDLEKEIFEPVSPVENETMEKEENGIDGDNIFREIEPFERTPLFTDKYDDNVFLKEEKSDSINEVNSLENVMPELFWLTNDESKKNDSSEKKDDSELSFDEQIEKLMNDDSSKVKKLVA